MTVPRLSVEEYSALVADWNRRVARGAVDPCPNHQWARLPNDTEDDPHMVCVNCMRPYRPANDRGSDVGDPRMTRPDRGQAKPW